MNVRQRVKFKFLLSNSFWSSRSMSPSKWFIHPFKQPFYRRPFSFNFFAVAVPPLDTHHSSHTMTATSTKRGWMERKDQGLACINYEITYGPISHCNYQFNGSPSIQLTFKEISNIPPPSLLLLQLILSFLISELKRKRHFPPSLHKKIIYPATHFLFPKDDTHSSITSSAIITIIVAIKLCIINGSIIIIITIIITTP